MIVASTLMIIFLTAIFGGIILYLIKIYLKEKESKVPILAGTKDEFVFRIDDELVALHGKYSRISYKKRSNSSKDIEV